MRVTGAGRGLAIIALLLGSFAAPAETVTGELVETYCWAKLQVGGVGHARCGIECAKRGIPIAVYDSRSRKVWILLPGTDKSALPPQLKEAMGRRVTVSGEASVRGNSQFLSVRSWQITR